MAHRIGDGGAVFLTVEAVSIFWIAYLNCGAYGFTILLCVSGSATGEIRILIDCIHRFGGADQRDVVCDMFSNVIVLQGFQPGWIAVHLLPSYADGVIFESPEASAGAVLGT